MKEIIISSSNNDISGDMSSFEITARQRELAKNNIEGLNVLDAGRGNPNWINTLARYAYIRLNEFALMECERDFRQDDMAGQPQMDGIYERFNSFLDPGRRSDAFLSRAVAYCVNELGMAGVELVREMCDGIIGCYYPYPGRSLKNTEKIVSEYLELMLYPGTDLKKNTDIFFTEGGSAAICYLIESLVHNRLVKRGDRIAIATPVFAPYLEIPLVNDYGIEVVKIETDPDNGWDLDPSVLDRVSDPSVKAFFIVNPANPGSRALSHKELDLLKDVVRKNPDLIVVTDDVYGSFVDGFRSIYSVIPHNTILIYSYSKLYGTTGWRLGLLAGEKNNICDELITRLSDDDKAFLENEYHHVTTNVPSMSFIDRIAADSRSIGLYHASGLSTPSQIFMVLLSLTHLAGEDGDFYTGLSRSIIHERYSVLMSELGMEEDESGRNSRYYALIDINSLCTKLYGEEFAEWKKSHVSDLDFLNDLSLRKGVVLTYGPGFASPPGFVRVSLANLKKEDYREIGTRVRGLLSEYHNEFAKMLSDRK